MQGCILGVVQFPESSGIAMKEAWPWRQRGLCAEGCLITLTVGQDSGQPKGPYRKRAGCISTPTSFSSLPLVSPGPPIGQAQYEARGHRRLSLWPVSLPRCGRVKRESGEANKASLTIHVDPDLKGHKMCWGRQILPGK